MKATLTIIILAGLATMTHARATLWGNSREQALLWATLNPDSPRAQANAAMAETGSGHPERARARLRPLLEKDPSQIQLALNLLSADCALGHVDKTSLDASMQALASTRDTGTLLTSWFERAIEQSDKPPCPELTLQTLQQLLKAAAINPNLTRLPGRRQDLFYLQGRLALKQGDADQALSYFNQSLDEQVRTGIALRQAALLGASGNPSQGLAHLDHYETKRSLEEPAGPGMPRIHAWILERQHYWPQELARLRHTLMADERAKYQHTP